MLWVCFCIAPPFIQEWCYDLFDWALLVVYAWHHALVREDIESMVCPTMLHTPAHAWNILAEMESPYVDACCCIRCTRPRIGSMPSFVRYIYIIHFLDGILNPRVM